VLIRQLLGIKLNSGGLSIEPVLPEKLNSLEVKLNRAGEEVVVKYSETSCLNVKTKEDTYE
jgi:cellobiose phosphorylase